MIPRKKGGSMKTLWLAIGFFVAFMLPSPAPSHAEIRSNLENPADGEPAAGISMISGWAFCTNSTMSYIEAFFNDTSVGPLPFGYSRIDVVNANPGVVSAISSGFGMEINWGNIPPGIYTLKIVFTCASGEKASVQRNIKTMRYGDAAFVDNFDLANATANLDKSTNPPQVVLNNVRIHNSETGEWKTITLRFQLSTSMQGLILTSTSMIGGDPTTVSYVFDAEADQQNIRVGVDEGIKLINKELASIGASLNPFTVYAFGNWDNWKQAYCTIFKIPDSNCVAATNPWQNIPIFSNSGGFVFFFTGGPMWTGMSESVARQSVSFHEVYHQGQFTLLNQGGSGFPIWFHEGLAQHRQFEWYAKQKGQPYSFYRDSYLKILKGDPCDLRSMESIQSTDPNIYPCGMFAVDLLQQIAPSVTPLQFWQSQQAAGGWKNKFQQVFGRNVQTFYAEFAAYRASLG